MKKLADLQKTSRGRKFLEMEGIFTDPGDFAVALEPPAEPRPLETLIPEKPLPRPVYTAQQVYADFTWPVVSKYSSLLNLNRFHKLHPIFLWADTDTCGADKCTNRVYWPGKKTAQSFRFVYQKYNKYEVRFVPFDHENTSRAFFNLERCIAGAVKDKKKKAQIKGKIETIKHLIEDESIRTVRDFNTALTDLMFAAGFGAGWHQLFFSDLLAVPEVQDSVNNTLNELLAYVKVQNETRKTMVGLGIDPVLPELSENYLPFWYSCPEVGRRSKLHRVCLNGDHWASSSQCKCGVEHRFYLGSNKLSMIELAETGRYSLDVSILIHLNDLFSGSVAGRSSGLYIVVLNNIMKKVLGRRPAPVFIPENWAQPNPDFFGLLHSYIIGSCENLGIDNE
jgi:hypothetical protein